LVHNRPLRHQLAACINGGQVTKSLMKIYANVDHQGVPPVLSLCFEHAYSSRKVRLLSSHLSEAKDPYAVYTIANARSFSTSNARAFVFRGPDIQLRYCRE
jgi:hypothetical protein